MSRIKELTGLIRLELIGVSFVDREYSPNLGNLGLRELVLIECPEAEVSLFPQGSGYGSLVTLHIEENMQEAMLPIQADYASREHMTSYNKSIQTAMFLTSMRRISGNSKYLHHSMKTTCYKWHKSFGCGPDVSEFSRLYEPMTFRVWTRPENLYHENM